MIPHNKDLTVDELLTMMIDNILLNLWYADYYNTNISLPQELRQAQAEAFRQDASSLVRFLHHKVMSGGALTSYRGIVVPTDYIVHLKDRETKFKHPES